MGGGCFVMRLNCNGCGCGGDKKEGGDEEK